LSTHRTDREGCRERALHWLVSSGVRGPDGAYTSTYRPSTREFACWYGNETCLLSTVGAVMALEGAGLADLALESARSICGLVVEEPPKVRGALRSGRGSPLVLSNWTLSAALALLRAHRLSGEQSFRDVAAEAGSFVIRCMQNSDGSLTERLALEGGARNVVNRMLLPRPLWAANCIEAFRELRAATGDEAFGRAADRFSAWLRPQQQSDGRFPEYRHSLLSRLVHALRRREPAELVRGCRRAHPTAQTHALHGLVLSGEVDAARLGAGWLRDGLSPNGLVYQYYFDDGSHCVEEDVMPTAHLGLLALEHAELGISPEVLDRIASALVYAQIRSSDPDADGAMRGLPLHPTLGEDAYCWDTAYAVMFLQQL
jgi:hypothetical protein